MLQLSATLMALLVAVSPVAAAAAGCDLFEVSARDDGPGIQAYDDPRTPWRVTINLSTAVIEITSDSGQCKTTLEDVSAVYMGLGDRVVFRTAQVASEELFTVNAKDCSEMGKPTDVDTTHEDVFRKILSVRHICPR